MDETPAKHDIRGFKERGPTKDTHLGPVLEWFIDDKDVKWVFYRTAIISENGIEISQLQRHECIAAPGAIYRKADFDYGKVSND